MRLAQWHARHKIRCVQCVPHGRQQQKTYYSCWQQQAQGWQNTRLYKTSFLPEPSLVSSLNTQLPIALVRNTWRPHCFNTCTHSKSRLFLFFYPLCHNMGVASRQPKHITIGQRVSGSVGPLLANPDPSKKRKVRARLYGYVIKEFGSKHY